MSWTAIEPPDKHYLIAALGWLQLGSHQDAESELKRIVPQLQMHPDVLEVRWAIYAQEKKWDLALSTARTLIQSASHRCSGWLHMAYALRRVEGGGIKLAWDALLPACAKFPDEPIIPYNLSCYACQMRRLDEARDWLRRALKLGKKDELKQMALKDPDLQPLWDEIAAL